MQSKNEAVGVELLVSKKFTDISVFTTVNLEPTYKE